MCIDCIAGVLRSLSVTETLSRWEAGRSAGKAGTIEMHSTFLAIPYQTSHLLFVTV